MTCIVGLIENNNVYIGGDAAGVSAYGLSICTRGDLKVFQNGDYLLGFTSSFRMGQVLRYRFNPPKLTHWDLERHMVTDFVDEVRKCFKEYGYGGSGREGDEGGTFLVGTRDISGTPRLFTIDGDFQVGIPTVGYDAVGCGGKIALGAMYALKDSDRTPEDKVTRALQAAEEFSAGVRGPFTVISLV